MEQEPQKRRKKDFQPEKSRREIASKGGKEKILFHPTTTETLVYNLRSLARRIQQNKS